MGPFDAPLAASFGARVAFDDADGLHVAVAAAQQQALGCVRAALRAGDVGVTGRIVCGDAWTLAKAQPSASVQCVVTSPPYWRQREYDARHREFGHEPLEEYVSRLADLFDELGRVLTATGAAWLNLGDTYEDGALRMVPARVVLALMSRGWQCRTQVIFDRLNFTPRPSPKRPVRSHEEVFLLTRSDDYFYDEEYMREPAKYAGYEYVRNGARAKDGRLRMDGATTVAATRIMRSVWTGSTGWGAETKHPAVMPKVMVERCVLSISRPGDLVLDPFAGSGTTGVVACGHGRDFLGWERKATFAQEADRRIRSVAPLFVA